MPDLIWFHGNISIHSPHKWSFGIKIEKDRDLNNFRRLYLSMSLLFGTIDLGIKYKNFTDL